MVTDALMKPNKIGALRKAKGWSKAELARRSVMQPGTIGWIEEGRFIPYDGQLSKIADALGYDGEPLELLQPLEVGA